jgi:hypothetical protein
MTTRRAQQKSAKEITGDVKARTKNSMSDQRHEDITKNRDQVTAMQKLKPGLQSSLQNEKTRAEQKKSTPVNEDLGLSRETSGGRGLASPETDQQ